MNTSYAVAKELDFYRIRETVAEFAVSEEGKRLLLEREPITDKTKIEYFKSLGREWNTYIESNSQQALHAWPPVEPYFKMIGKEGAQLEQDQIFAIGLFCLSQEQLKESIASAQENITIPNLAEETHALPDISQAQREIFSVINTDGQVKDLPALRTIRNRISSLHKEIESAIRKYTSDPSLSTALQSNVPAFKADRELLAVRADRRNAIKGIVHEVSASGQTMYIEPDEVVRANNELIQEEYRLQAELKKIFRELTAKIGIYKDEFLASLKTLVMLDSAYAAARWQAETNGVFAENCDLALEPPAIRGARHPLLGSKAVPVDICFLDGKRILIITGPNTGGKTVTLKTIALFALLNQAGFPVPAEEGTRLPIFSSVFADIGDEQSIDESLSTFSSHMKKMAQMIQYADKDSLILLDELGSGTDPQEGGAIAMATLDSLIERDSFVIVTTHHGILKNYGYTHPKCINASVEFDNTTLQPTYRLLMGIPGESHALDIAARSGLPEDIVQKAREYISSEQADVSTLIKGLTAKHEELDELQRQERIQNAELQQKALKLHEREIKAKEREIELQKAEHASSTEFLRKTRKKLENLVRELREGEITREKTLGVKQFISMLEEQVQQQTAIIEEHQKILEEEKEDARKEEALYAENGMRLAKYKESKSFSNKKTKRRLSNAEALTTASVPEYAETPVQKIKKTVPVELLFEPGIEVLAGAARRRGTLVSKNRNGSWTVQFGSLKMSIPQNQLVPVAPERMPTAEINIESINNTSIILEDESPKFELRLLGMRYEEAMKALEHQVDLCAIHNFKEFSVIHGKGSGILQQAVHDYLSHYPGIKEFHFAQPEDGGTGKTYVSLR
ncbi:MAG: Smr/MutS family protein [Treponema sp.]|nr:Smr/MutS family protein [Treponema sp.]